MRTRTDNRLIAKSQQGFMNRYRISDSAYMSAYYWVPEDDYDRALMKTENWIKYTSERNTKEELGYRRSNDCYHRAQTVQWMPWNGPDYYGPTYYYKFYGMFMDRPPYEEYASNLDLNVKPDESFNSRAFEAMKPDLESSLSLSNFLVEIADVKHLARFFTGWKTSGSLKGLSRKSAEGHLSWKFGLKPFFNDVKLMYSLLIDHSKRIEEFLDKRNTLQVRHYSEKEPYTESVSGWNAWQGGNNMYWRYRTFQSSVTTATMVYRYTCDDISTRARKAMALCDSLGLVFRQSTIWEAIPFSFAIDWIFRVQDYLKANEDPLIKAKVIVLDYTVSHKITYRCDREWKYWSAPNGASWATKTDCRHQGKSYQRTRQLPDADNTFINRGQYGHSQLALSASLVRLVFFRK